MTAKEINAIISDIEGSYSKEQIQTAWYPYAIEFYKKRMNKSWGDVKADTVMHMVLTRKNPNKADMALVGFSVLQNEEVFREFLATLPSYLPVLFEALLYEKSLSRQKVRAITGQDILAPSAREYGTPTIKKEFALFSSSLSSSYYGYGEKYADVLVETYLPVAMKKLLVHYFPKPAGFTITPVPAPIGERLVFFNAEESINRELPSLTTYFLQEQIKYSDKGRPIPSGMKKLQRTLQLSEFLPGGEFPTMRSLLMAGLLYPYKINSVHTHAHQIIKLLFVQHFQIFPSAPYIFTQLKGFTYFHPSDFDKTAPKSILQVFSQLTEGQWVTMENVYIYVKTHFIEPLPLSAYKLLDKVYYEDKETYRKQYIRDSLQAPFIIRPYLAGAAFLCGAFGLMELCYEDKDPVGKFGEDWFSEYDGLKAIKLTALGAYVLGLRKEYEAPVTNSDNRLSPDPESLMIRVEGNAELAHIQLSNYAQKIADNRYLFSPSLFLKDCKTAKDIENKITLFRQSVGAKFPPFWEDYFRRLLSNNKLITPEKNLSVYRLPPADKELQRLLVQDEVLRKLVIKAEQFFIIIEKANEAPFRSRLKEAGILLD